MAGRSKRNPTHYVPIASIAAEHPLRILLTEDNLINQKMMVMLLRKLGYEILVAGNGREALTVLEREAVRGPQHEIEVILMDASMDVMDGMECTRVIRVQQLPHRKRPFIIAQTANVSEEFKQKCLSSGMSVTHTHEHTTHKQRRSLVCAGSRLHVADCFCVFFLLPLSCADVCAQGRLLGEASAPGSARCSPQKRLSGQATDAASQPHQLTSQPSLLPLPTHQPRPPTSNSALWLLSLAIFSSPPAPLCYAIIRDSFPLP